MTQSDANWEWKHQLGSMMSHRANSAKGSFIREHPGTLPVSVEFGVALGVGGEGGPAGEDGGGEAAAGGEFAAHDAPFRANGGDDVAEDFVDSIFVEDAQAAVGEEIHFQGFQLDAIFFGHVLDGDGTEVGETGLGADGRVFWKASGNDVAGKLIGPGFKRGQFCLDAGAGVFCGVVGHACSSSLLYRDEGQTFSCRIPRFSPTLVEERNDQH